MITTTNVIFFNKKDKKRTLFLDTLFYIFLLTKYTY